MKCAHPGTPHGAGIVSNYVGRHFAGVYKVWSGPYCKYISGTQSRSIHGTGRAIDIMVSGFYNGDVLANWIVMNAKGLGVQMVIWRHSSWKAERGTTNYYASSNHNDHIHVEFTDAGAAGHTSWFASGSQHRSPTNPSLGGGGSAPAPAPAPLTYKAKFEKVARSQVNGVKLTGHAGQTRDVEFAFKNTGTGTWNAGEMKVLLSGRTSAAAMGKMNSSWKAGTVLKTLPIAGGPGSVRSFPFNVLLPSNHSGLRVYVTLVRDAGGKRTSLAGGTGQTPIYFDVAKPVPGGAFVKLENTSVNGVDLKGEVDAVRNVRFAFKNTGQDLWKQDQVRLFVAPAMSDDVAALVRTDSWAGERVIGTLDSDVARGESQVFDFDVRSPAGQDGLRFMVALHYRPTADATTGRRWLAGGPDQEKVYFDIDQPAWAAEFVETESTDPNHVLVSGYDDEVHRVEFAFKNTGASIWHPEQVKLVLGSRTPYDEHGMMTPTWLSGSELATPLTVVGPGEVGRFSFDVDIPDHVDKAETFVSLVVDHEAGERAMAGTEHLGELSFDVVRLERSIVTTAANGETTVLPVYDDGNEPETVPYAYAASASPSSSAYDHEGIKGGCSVQRDQRFAGFGLFMVVAVLVARRRR